MADDAVLPVADGGAGSSSVTVPFRITKDDFRRAQWLHVKPRPAYAITGIVLLALVGPLLFIALVVPLTQGRLPPTAILVATAGVAYLGGIALYTRWKIGRVYDQMKALHGEFTMTVDERGIHSSSERGTATMLYSDILRIREDERVVLVYHADNLFNMVPKSSPLLIEAAARISELHRQYCERSKDRTASC